MTSEMDQAISKYFSLLKKWNRSIRLVSSAESEDEFRQRHVRDVEEILPLLAGINTMIDIGTGAGLPGIPIKIARPEIDVVLLDHPTAGTKIDEVVESLRAAKPGLTIVGNSGADRRQEFARAGVKRFLDKPWRVDELITILKGRMRSCGECGLPLPLRRPLEGEVGGHWVCAFCGSRYLGLLDEDAPEQLISNARRAECT